MNPQFKLLIQSDSQSTRPFDLAWTTIGSPVHKAGDSSIALGGPPPRSLSDSLLSHAVGKGGFRYLWPEPAEGENTLLIDGTEVGDVTFTANRSGESWTSFGVKREGLQFSVSLEDDANSLKKGYREYNFFGDGVLQANHIPEVSPTSSMLPDIGGKIFAIFKAENGQRDFADLSTALFGGHLEADDVAALHTAFSRMNITPDQPDATGLIKHFGFDVQPQADDTYGNNDSLWVKGKHVLMARKRIGPLLIKAYFDDWTWADEPDKPRLFNMVIYNSETGTGLYVFRHSCHQEGDIEALEGHFRGALLGPDLGNFRRPILSFGKQSFKG